MPPLRERLDDVALLAERFLQRYGEKYSKRMRGISQAALCSAHALRLARQRARA